MKDGENINTFNYVYDKIGQLTEVKKNNSTIESYSYDSNGNRLNNNAQYDSQDRLISNSSTTFGYTERGTLLTRTENNQTTSYNYDLMGNLLSVSLPNNTNIEYITDARNRRIAKKVNGTVVQKFLYLNQLEPIAELDANDNIISLFIYGTRSNTPDYIVKNNIKYKVVTNQLGSVVKVVNTTNGTVEQAIEYDSFGNILSDSNPNFQPFRLAGGLYDVDTKLTRFGARDYDARDGRWTTKDPIKFDGGINFYVYAGNNAVNYVDLNGRKIGEIINISDFSTESVAIDSVAQSTIQEIICSTIKKQKEYSFTIYKITYTNGSSSLISGDLVGGDKFSVPGQINTNPKISGSGVASVSVVATGHTHVFCNSEYNSESFSDSDMKNMGKYGDVYVGTVQGSLRKWNKKMTEADGINGGDFMGRLDLSNCQCESARNNECR